jgi:hypothetical protein
MVAGASLLVMDILHAGLVVALTYHFQPTLNPTRGHRFSALLPM